MRNSLIFLLLAIMLLGACAQQPSMPDNHGDGSMMGMEGVFPLSTPDDDREGDLLYQLLVGEIAGQMGYMEVAAEHYHGAAMGTTDPRVAERATRIALFANRYDQALPTAWRWVELAPENLEGRQVLAALLINTGEVEPAVEQMDYVLRVSPASEAATFGSMANLISRTQNRPAALSALEGLVSRHPDRPLAQLTLAQMALQMDRPDLAERAAGRALELDAGLHDARVVLSQALARQGRMDQALEGLRTAVSAHPDNAQLGLAYGRLLIQAREFDAARRAFERLVALRPDDVDLLYTLGLLNIEVERYEDAESYMRQLLATGRRSHEANFYLGRIAEDDDRMEDALRHYQGVGDGEHFQEAKLREAMLMGRLGRVAEAQRMLREFRGETDEPDWRMRLYVTESQVLRDAHDYESAMAVLDEGLTEQPDSKEMLYTRALVAERMDRLDILEEDLSAVLAMDPENSAALNALGYTLADRTDRLDEAYRYIHRAHALRPDDAAILDSMGWVLYRMGRYDDAEPYLRRAYETLYDPEIASNLAALLWAQGQREEAWRILNDALSKDPDHDRLLRLKDRLER